MLFYEQKLEKNNNKNSFNLPKMNILQMKS